MTGTIGEGMIMRMVLTEMAREGYLYAPVGVSMRHVHLSRQDLDVLFGTGYELHPLRELVQPGQFAAQEQVTLHGPKGRLEKVRIIGPVRKETQVELSLTDALSIGMKNLPVRMSGQLKDTPGIRIVGPAGELTTSGGTIVAARHLHLSEEQARAFHVHDGQVVSVKVDGERPVILERVICRTGKGHELEFHVDTDEANTCLLKNGDMVQVLTNINHVNGVPGTECNGPGRAGMMGWTDSLSAAGGPAGNEETFDPARISEKVVFSLTGRAADRTDSHSLYREEIRTGAGEEVLELVTEQDINNAFRGGRDHVYRAANALVTPSAADRSSELGIRILKADGPVTISGRAYNGSAAAGPVSASSAAAGPASASSVSAGPASASSVSASSQAAGLNGQEELLDLVTVSELNAAFRDNKTELYCTKHVIITPAAMERIAETGIRIVRV